MQTDIAHNKEIEPEEFKAMIRGFVNQKFENIDSWAEHPEILTENLREDRKGLEDLREKIRTALPPSSELDLDIELLINRLKRQELFVENKWVHETPEKRQSDVEAFKQTIENQLANVDYASKEETFKAINADLDSVFGKDAVFGNSLNEDNLKGIIHKVLVLSQNDLDKLKMDQKPSGMILDVDDLDHLSDQVIEELKKEKQDETEVDVAALM